MSTETRLDGMESMYKGISMSRSIRNGGGSGMMYLNNGVGLQGAYARGGLYARVVDIPADMALSRGIQFEGDQEHVDKVTGEMDRLQVYDRLADLGRWARLDGAAALLVLTDDGDLYQPLSARFGKITDIRVIEYGDISLAPRNSYYEDQGSEQYGQPQMYSVNIQGVRGSWQTYVHESRIIPLTLHPLPRQYRDGRNVPWAGRSAVIRTYDAIDELQLVMALGRAVLERKQQGVHEMFELQKMLEMADPAVGEALVRKRIDMIDAGRSLTNSVVVDKEDGYKVYDLTLNGIPDMINQWRIAVTSESGLSQSLLFERTKGGIGDAGNSELESDYDIAEALQQKLNGPLKALIGLMARQSGFDNLYDNVKVVWPTLWTPTEQQQADARAKNAQADRFKVDAVIAAVDASLVSQDEGRNWLAQEGLAGAEAVALPKSPDDGAGDDENEE